MLYHKLQPDDFPPGQDYTIDMIVLREREITNC